MKKVVLSAAIAIAALQSQAQITIAPEIGLNMAKETGKYNNGDGFQKFKGMKWKPGFKAGAVVTIPIAKGFMIQPGAFFSMKGLRQGLTFDAIEIKGWSKVNVLEIPLNLGYEKAIGNAGTLFVMAGPYLGVGLSAKSKLEMYQNGILIQKIDQKVSFGTDSTDALKRFDFGVNFSAGYRLPMGLYTRVQYGMGFTNTLPTHNDVWMLRNRVLSLSFGYNFQLSRKK